MYYQYIDTNCQRFYPQVTKFWDIKLKKMSYFRIFLITHLCIKKGGKYEVFEKHPNHIWKGLNKKSTSKKI